MTRDITITGLAPCGTKVVLRVDGARGYDVTVPMNDRGWEAIRGVLEAREMTPDAPSIGTPASPTQAMIDEYIAKNGVRQLSANRREAVEDERYARLFGEEDELDLEIEI